MGILALMLCALIGGAQAQPYWLNDNWTYIFGSGTNATNWLLAGNPGTFSSVTQFDSTINDSAQNLVGYYFLTGTGTGTGSGIDLTGMTLTIYDTTGTNIVWTGSANSSVLPFSQNVPQANFQQAPYNPPFGTYTLAGGIQNGVGSPIVFTKTSGSAAYSAVDLDWLGLELNSNLVNGKQGNLDGEITPLTSTVPEPASIVLGLMGLGSLAGFGRFRRRAA